MPLYLPGGAAGPMTAAIEALATTGLIDRTGPGTATTRATGTAGLNVLAAADEAAARTAIGAMANTDPEIITNANGTAYRWPNGLQICTFIGLPNSTTAAIGNVFRSTSVENWTFPASFSGQPVLYGNPNVVGRWCALDSINVNASTTARVRQYGPISDATLYENFVCAIGTYTP